MIVKLVRDLEVDLNNMPSDFEEQVQQCFSEFTKGTKSDYMFHTQGMIDAQDGGVEG